MEDEQIKKQDSNQPTKNQDPDNNIEKLMKEKDEYLDGWKRAKADFLNYKKDELKRIESILKLSNEQLIRDLIPVLDSFDLALESLGEESKLEKGVYLIRSQFEDVLKKYGLEKVFVQIGTAFDPVLHEAVASVENSKYGSGMIIEEVERGYTLAGKLIRPARVKVAS